MSTIPLPPPPLPPNQCTIISTIKRSQEFKLLTYRRHYLRYNRVLHILYRQLYLLLYIVLILGTCNNKEFILRETECICICIRACVHVWCCFMGIKTSSIGFLFIDNNYKVSLTSISNYFRSFEEKLLLLIYYYFQFPLFIKESRDS